MNDEWHVIVMMVMDGGMVLIDNVPVSCWDDETGQGDVNSKVKEVVRRVQVE